MSYFTSPHYKYQILKIHNNALDQWVQPNDQIYIQTRQGKTFAIASGNIKNPPVILIHGSGSNSNMWLNDARILSDSYRVYAIDIPGDAGKSEEYRASWENNDYIEWLEDIYNYLNINRAIVIGISIGGWISVKWASHYPEKVSKLVLLCASGFATPRISFIFKAIFLTFLGNYGQKKMEQMIFHSKNIDSQTSEYFKLISKGFKPRKGFPPLFTDEELNIISMPLLYLGGDHDVLIDIEKTVQRIKRIIPQSNIKIIKNMGHAITNVTEEISTFIK